MKPRPPKARPPVGHWGKRGGAKRQLGIAGDRLAELERVARIMRAVTAEHAERGRVPSHWMAL